MREAKTPHDEKKGQLRPNKINSPVSTPSLVASPQIDYQVDDADTRS